MAENKFDFERFMQDAMADIYAGRNGAYRFKIKY